MTAKGKSPLAQVFDLPLVVAALLVLVYYACITSGPLADSMLAHYTAEHVMEYVVVAFFIWGLTDIFFRALTLPREFLAISGDWLPHRGPREPASRAAMLQAHLRAKPKRQLESRMGRRLTKALAYVQEKGAADDLADYLRHLAEGDAETTHSHYALARFICVITPMFGFLGTVVHFGTALGGQAAGDIADKLPTVVAEMGTAFNTTTIALVAATTMMFALFVCERAERGLVTRIDRRTDGELLNRFEIVNASLTPFVTALEQATKATVASVDQALERHLSAAVATLQAIERQTAQMQQRQTQAWVEALAKMDVRYETSDAAREQRLLRVLERMEEQRAEHRTDIGETSHQLATLKKDFVRLIEQLATIAKSEHHLSASQAVLSENLRVLRESQQLDQALHGLTAAVHTLTSRQMPSPKDARAA